MDSEPVLNSPANSVPWHSHTLGSLGSSRKTHLRDGGEPGSAGDTLGSSQVAEGAITELHSLGSKEFTPAHPGRRFSQMPLEVIIDTFDTDVPRSQLPLYHNSGKKKKKPSWPQTSYVAEDVLILFTLIFRGQGLIIGHSTKLMQYSGVKSTN